MRRLLLWSGVIAAPVLGFLLRYRAHAAHAFDPETSLAATAGREFVHGMLRWLPHYQFNLHQGSQTLDALLSMPGYLLFGDHTMAWGFVGLLWTALTALAGAVVLRQLVGWTAATLFAALLTVAPFAVKDGLMALSGGHPQVAAWMLGALACALRARRVPDDAREGPDRSAQWALLAGALVGVGAWYTRSVVLAAPIVAGLVWPGWSGGTWRSELAALKRDPRVLAVGRGLCLLPVLLVLQVGSQLAAGTHLSTDEALLQRTLNPIVNMDDCSKAQLALGLCEDEESRLELRSHKLAEALGAPLANELFAQPAHLVTRAQRRVPGAGIVGVSWVLGWVCALGALGWGALGVLGWGALGPRRETAALRPLLLMTGIYLGAYVFASMRIENAPRDWLPVEVWEASRPTTLRYLVPLWLMLTACVAGWAASWLRAGGPRAWLAGCVVGAMLLGGAAEGAVDVLTQADPPAAFATHRPFRYLRNYAAHRGPPRQAHRVCEVRDPISRANHLRAWATWRECGIECLQEDPGRARVELDRMRREASEGCAQPLSDADAAFLAHGLGIAVGSAGQFWEAYGVVPMVELAWRITETLPGEDAHWFLEGVTDALWDHGEMLPLDEQLALFCPAEHAEHRELCVLVGLRMCEMEGAPKSPYGLCSNRDAPKLLRMEPELARAVLEGAGWGAGGRAPVGAAHLDWSAWPPELKEVFLRGWRTGGRFRWAPPTPMRYVPTDVP